MRIMIPKNREISGISILFFINAYRRRASSSNNRMKTNAISRFQSAIVFQPEGPLQKLSEASSVLLKEKKTASAHKYPAPKTPSKSIASPHTDIHQPILHEPRRNQIENRIYICLRDMQQANSWNTPHQKSRPTDRDL